MSHAVISSTTLHAAWVCMLCLTRRWVLFAIALTPVLLLGQPLEAKLVAGIGHQLEERIRPSVSPRDARLEGIIVLGGSPTRIRSALQLAERFPEAMLVLSGPGDNEVVIAQERASVERIGTLVIDRRARNTYENALYSKDLVTPHSGQCWIVVTSAVHMPRAVGAFEAVGFPVLPWPVDDTPQLSEGLSTWVWREAFGLIAYRAFGRTRDLSPKGPDGACADPDWLGSGGVSDR
jgi:uncharacterized SAM-binding protein YcdF (DUF218 family)